VIPLIPLIFLIPILLALFYVAKRIHKNTTIIPEVYHDVKKLMILLNIKAEEKATVPELKALFSESIDLIGLQLPVHDSQIADTAISESIRFEKFIKHTIELTKKDKKSKTTIYSNVQFTNSYLAINDIKLAYILRLLLEYFLNIHTQKSIYLDISSFSDQLIMRLSSEDKFKKGHKNLELLLARDEIAQPKKGNHSNLLRLQSLIAELHGEVRIMHKFNDQEQADYLVIGLLFEKKEGDDHG